MSIKAGDRIPEAKFTVMTDKGPAPLATPELFGGKKVVLFSVPGAFTPTCSAKHLPRLPGPWNAGAKQLYVKSPDGYVPPVLMQVNSDK